LSCEENLLTWTLTGTNAVALLWTVQQGTLDIAGWLANSRFTVSGGLLTGNGTVGAVRVNNGGTIAPGKVNAFGRLFDVASWPYLVGRDARASPACTTKIDRGNQLGAARRTSSSGRALAAMVLLSISALTPSAA
jgi:hypothetical protein